MLDKLAFDVVTRIKNSDLFWRAVTFKPDLLYLLKDAEIARDADGISVWNRTAEATKIDCFLMIRLTHRLIDQREEGY